LVELLYTVAKFQICRNSMGQYSDFLSDLHHNTNRVSWFLKSSRSRTLNYKNNSITITICKPRGVWFYFAISKRSNSNWVSVMRPMIKAAKRTIEDSVAYGKSFQLWSKLEPLIQQLTKAYFKKLRFRLSSSVPKGRIPNCRSKSPSGWL
jgi:hypothetical protein